MRVEPQDAEKQTLPAWQLTKILCIQVTAAERLVLLPNTVLTEKLWQFSKRNKTYQNIAEGSSRKRILNKNTKQTGFTDSVTKVCGLLSPPCQ